LQDLLLGLVDMLEAESEESQSLEREKSAHSSRITYKEETSTGLSDGSGFCATPPQLQSELPPSSQGTPGKKRPISQTSFEAHSTETTPNKLEQAEAKVQALQNTFVRNIINQLWRGAIPIPWARGRRMILTYTEFVPSLFGPYIIDRIKRAFSTLCERTVVTKRKS